VRGEEEKGKDKRKTISSSPRVTEYTFSPVITPHPDK
jgi:hypothetical protein